MRRTSARTTAAIAFALVIAACSSSAAEPTTTTAPATTTTTTTKTTTTTTTTTTTEPPGLAAQTLRLGLAADRYVQYQVTSTVSLDATVAGVLAEEPPGPDSFSLAFDLTARQLQLTLAGPGESFEIIAAFKPEEGTMSGKVNRREFNQEMDGAELLEFEGTLVPLLIDDSATVVEGYGGTPAFYRTEPGAFEVLGLVGPPLIDDPVDVGDTWSSVIPDPLIGDVTVNVEITGEEETEDGWVFVIEYTTATEAVPIEWDLTEALDLVSGQIGATGIAELLQAPGTGEATGSITISEAEMSGSVRFDPVRGIAISSESATKLSMGFDISVGDGTGSLDFSVATSDTLTLTYTDDVKQFQMDTVLSHFEVDPYDLAAAALDPLVIRWWPEPDLTEDELTNLVTPFDELRQDWIGGVSVGQFGDGSGSSVTVLSITNAGEFRGAPDLSEGLIGYLSGRNPTAVALVDKAVAYRGNVDGAEWLMWNDETHTFLMVGPRDLSRQMMTALAEASDPYLWQEGDCLDFSDGYLDSAPFAPYGTLGLVHCQQDHMFEVVYGEALPQGPDERFDTVLWEGWLIGCGQRGSEYIGLPDLATALDLSTYAPNEAEWDQGARYTTCLASLMGPEGRELVTGRLGGLAPEHPITVEEGVCLKGTFPVPCSDPHNSEVFAILEYPAAGDDPFPGLEVYDEDTSDACEAAFEEWEVVEGDTEIFSRRFSDAPVDWDIGVRTYYCVASTADEFGFFLDVTGSFTGEWEEAAERTDA